ncbi:hypothetical protein AVDCRST_MAG81-1991 [uncultured Synechococcales cyanobacterium]|uniref:Uncharacterized protein n=1 Tax=uncultured Synechococcales cyanobacterium TaxID=1936017 RepID=A0A6J4UIS8_9CYAN|nr:hypothetical protein AVDCRST_MAG81-1991 [uncultured Synechococcales cyanobacterium]
MPHKPSDLDTLSVLGLQNHLKQLGQESHHPLLLLSTHKSVLSKRPPLKEGLKFSQALT